MLKLHLSPINHGCQVHVPRDAAYFRVHACRSGQRFVQITGWTPVPDDDKMVCNIRANQNWHSAMDSGGESVWIKVSFRDQYKLRSDESMMPVQFKVNTRDLHAGALQ